MKKLISMVLVFTMLFSLVVTINVSAVEKVSDESAEIGTYKELNGDIMTIEMLGSSVNRSSANVNKNEPFKFQILRNGNLEEVLVVDLANNKVIHEYVDGSKKVEVLSEIVTITPYVPSKDDGNELQNSDMITPFAVDYVDNEHFNILPNGDQAILSGGLVYDDYRAMGYRGGYYYAPNTYGYLQRRNAGILRTDYANRFSFGAGTTIGTAAGIIVAAVTSAGWTLAISVVTAMLGAVIDVVTYDWSVKFEKRTYNWLYRVRLNSNTGQIIYTTFRTKDYWRAYNEATGAAEFEYAGSRYDDGFLLSNFELIKAAIDSYLE